MQSLQPYGVLVIRLGMAGVLLWFGAQQLMEPENWVGFIPDYATALSGLTPQTLVHLNGSAEIASGVLLALGLFTRPVAFVMSAHLALIALSLGSTAVAVRDWGLAAATLGLVFTGSGVWGLDD